MYRMAKQTLAKWRESASLIILARDSKLPRTSFDYKALLFSRHQRSSFMANSSVFPGGVCETADEAPMWLNYLMSCGVKPDRLELLTAAPSLRAGIFTTRGEDCLKKELSLRITAIRETFEEVGILFGRDRKTFHDPCDNGYGHFCENFDREHWQRLVHQDPAKFLTLCEQLDIVPDLWSLHEWSAWLTPSTFKKRFETAFYLITLRETPSLVLEKNEVNDCMWKTPLEYLLAHIDKQLVLPPPQFYELSRLLNIQELEELRKFAHSRAACNGTTLLLPVMYKCSDGNVALLPGDDMYPSDPDASTDLIPTHMTTVEFRAGAKQFHRSESLHQGAILLNTLPADGHLPPKSVREL